ncbi:MAG: hypothetical protein COA50_07340 [Flavobacteriaceae bacterium]|nr:MAG: hypothetical protein COA50_07340 [Flavobacteriaceae bacterium]
MSKFLFILLVLFSLNSWAQNYDFIDNKVRNYPEFKSINHLGVRISNDFDKDSLRLRAAFTWLTHNISYKDKSISEVFKPKEQLVYYSEFGKELLLRKKKLERIEKAFAKKSGVCLDYSLLLHELCTFFTLESKIIYGIGKNEIRSIKGEQLFKNHSWNAVKINGEWRLMDATWASGYIDLASDTFIKRFIEHYYLTKPSEFIKHHFPTHTEWQLLHNPIDIETFYSAPIFLPEYFQKDIKLATETKGIIQLTKENEYILLFEKIPKSHPMHYTINGSGQSIKIGFKKDRVNNSYISKIKLRKNLNSNDLLTIFLEQKPILNFIIQKEK